MVYLDTNVFIYAAIDQVPDKKTKSIELIRKLIESSEFGVSTLVLQEMVFSLAKLGMNKQFIERDFHYYSRFHKWDVSKEIMIDSVTLGLKLNGLKSINDLIHLKLAEKFCSRLITFDKEFSFFKAHTELEIVVLN